MSEGLHTAQQGGEPPRSYHIGDDIDWDSPWVDVLLCVELPFWLFFPNGTMTIEQAGCPFQVRVTDLYFELFYKEFCDSRGTVVYNGPYREHDDLSPHIRDLADARTKLFWRKCKTVVSIASRANESVLNWKKTPVRQIFLSELCRAHIPILNSLIQAYRLSSYDYFAYEISPWDVPRWMLRRGSQISTVTLVPYREWDGKPLIHDPNSDGTQQYTLVAGEDVFAQMQTPSNPGELELLDAMNLMERGDWTGAVRRISTAIEVAVSTALRREMPASEADAFLRKTKMNFAARLKRLGELRDSGLSKPMADDLDRIRELRNQIVHRGYRIQPSERGIAQRCVDTGRWIYNKIENEPERQRLREKRVAFRSLGRDLLQGAFRAEITAEGVTVCQH